MATAHWVLTPKPENHLFISHHHISWSYSHCLSKCHQGGRMRSRRARNIRSNAHRTTGTDPVKDMVVHMYTWYNLRKGSQLLLYFLSLFTFALGTLSYLFLSTSFHLHICRLARFSQVHKDWQLRQGLVGSGFWETLGDALSKHNTCIHF